MGETAKMYGELAWLWPILSPKEDYVEESEFIARAIKEHSVIEPVTLLHMGCGGGHNDYTLKKHFEITGVDTSPDMLELARGLNPEAWYLEGDMRSVRLNRQFDAVIILDSIACMLSEDDLGAALANAGEHLRPGGVFLTVAEMDPDNFVQNRTGAWARARGEVELAFIENYFDPDPTDSTYECTFIYLIRKGGRLTIETDRQLGAMFAMDTWRRAFASVGFEMAEVRFMPGGEPDQGFPILLGLKPGRTTNPGKEVRK